MRTHFTIRIFVFSVITISTIFIQSCSDDISVTPVSTLSPLTNTYSSVTASAWFNLELNLIKQSPSLGFSPPVASRTFGYTGIVLYESVVYGMPEYQSLAGQLNGLNSLPVINQGNIYHWPTCANAALANIVRKLFSNATSANLITIDSLEEALNIQYQTEVSSDVFERSKEFGLEISNTIYTWSLNDGGNEGQFHNTDPGYQPPSGPGLWEPTAPNYSPAVQPYWGNNRPFIPANVYSNQPPTPVTYSSSDTSLFYTQALEVFSTSNKLTSDQREIALFWADAGETYTPPGHWVAITEISLKKLNSKLDVSAIAYAKLGIAVSDAFVSCWKTKFQFNLLRPITYIRNFISPGWTPLISTPPFPEYTSGHSSQSGAAAQVLSDVFGYSFSFIDNSHPELSLAPRNFNSFFEAANEAAISRLYGGIHYRAANERGLQCGINIGRNVSALNFLR
ncbi:MAG: vanadium-dependent haloperoxidase [Ignavibacteria bacterium]